jgi:ABC-2 type transport system permease protein
MRTIFIIIQREYLSRVKQKAFLISTFVAPIGFALLIFASSFLSTYGSGEKKVVAIIDNSNLLQRQSFEKENDSKISYKYSTLSNPTLTTLSVKDEADVYIMIPSIDNLLDSNHITIKYLGEKHLGLNDRQTIERTIEKKLEDVKLQSLKLNASQIEKWNVNAKLEYINPADEKESSAFTSVATVLGIIIGIAIYIILIFYGVSIMRGVLEEKTSRIVEVIISSVRPFQLLISKVIGIGLVGITQFLVWAVIMVLINIVLLPMIGLGNIQNNQMPNATLLASQNVDMELIQASILELNKINWTLVFGGFIVYFLGGFFLYGSIFAALGATINEDGETQSLSMVVTTPIMISFFIALSVVNDPNSKLAFWASIFPLSSPIVMPARIPFEPPMWEILLSVCILIISFLGTIWLASRIYRVGILMYGKKANWKEIVTWLFYKEQ